MFLFACILFAGWRPMMVDTLRGLQAKKREPRPGTCIKRLPSTKLQWKWVAYKCPLYGCQAMKCEYGLLSKKTGATKRKNKLCISFSSHRAVTTSSYFCLYVQICIISRFAWLPMSLVYAFLFHGYCTAY